jgi:putative redox protein
MATVESKYLGELRTEATHLKSNTRIITDAPIDNHGKGEFFSPTDLVATAFGSCIMTVLGIAAETHHFDISGATWKITKIMTESPRRIGEVVVELAFPRDYSDKEKSIINHCISNCPVALSLHPDLKQSVSVTYGCK